MPPAKHAAKKTATKHAPHDAAIKDERRAFEHRGRVEGLHRAIDAKTAGDVELLIDLADRQLGAGRMKDAADLLRAAEHLSFASIQRPKAADEAHPKLQEEIAKEFKHKLEKAEELWASDSDAENPLQAVYDQVLAHAQKALKDGAHHRALELARAAEALAHVELQREEEPADDETK